MIKQVWVAQNPFDENDISISFRPTYDMYFYSDEQDKYGDSKCESVEYKPAMLVMED